MSHSDQKSGEENAKQTEGTLIRNLPYLEIEPLHSSLPDLEIIPLPSTSKELDGNEKSVTITSMAHIVPLQSSGKDGPVKYVQVSPIKSLPKQQIKNLIKLPASPFPGLSIDNFQKFHVSNRVQVLKPVKDVPLESVKTARKIVEIFKNSQEINVSKSLSVPSTSKNTSDDTSSSAVLKRILPSMRSVPAILQKRAKLDAPKNTPSTSGETANSSNQISDSTESTKINNKCMANQEPKIINKLLKNQESKLYIEIEYGPTNEVTLDNNDNEKQTRNKMSKRSSIKKAVSPRSPKKKQKDKDKDATKRGSGETIYVADGFREDVENLIEKCLQANKLNFERFCNVWKEMDFPCIFHGRQSGAELAELSEEVIHIAKEYMLAKNDNFEENVAGLFLVYALLNHQPFAGFAALRLVPRDVPVVLSVEAEARRQKRHDVLYVLGSVLIKGPCQFHVFEREVSLEPMIRKYYDGTVQASNVMNNVCTRNSLCVPLFKKLISLDESYAAVQKKLEKYKEEDKLVHTSKRPAAELYQMFQALIPRADQNEQSSTELVNEILSASKPEEKRADLLKSIKERAMTNTVDSLKHLTGIDDRQQDITLSSSEDSEGETRQFSQRPKFLGRSNSTALSLQKFFSCKETNHDLQYILQSSQKQMPTRKENDPAKKQTKKGKPVNKKTRKKAK